MAPKDIPLAYCYLTVVINLNVNQYLTRCIVNDFVAMSRYAFECNTKQHDLIYIYVYIFIYFS